MADPQRTPRTISEAGGAGAVPNDAPPHPEQVEDAIHDGAPAGLVFGDAELPVVSVAGGPPVRLGGYSPDPGPAPQVSILDDPRQTQFYQAPSGVRR